MTYFFDKMEIYRLLNAIVDRYSRGKLADSIMGFSNKKPVDTTVIDEVRELLNDVIVIHNYGTDIIIDRIIGWQSVYEAILERIDITYLCTNNQTNHFTRFIKCLAGCNTTDDVDIIYVGNFLDSVSHIMKNKSIKKMRIWEHNGTYRFGHQLVDLKTRNTDICTNDLTKWYQEMKAIGWIFINTTGINRTEKIMKLIDISVSTVD